MSGEDARGVIFDMDGVLIDSFHAHFESWRRLAAENGRVYTESQFVAGFGRTSREVLAAQWDEALGEERVRALDERKESLFRELIAEHFPPMDGAVDLVRALGRAGFRLAVGSSGPPANVRLAIDRLGIGDDLAATVTGGDVCRGKPDPQVFDLAASRLGLRPDRCVVIEDAPVGIEAARRGGMHCVGLASTGRTQDQLAQADLVVTSLRALSPLVLGGLIEDGLGRNGGERSGGERR